MRANTLNSTKYHIQTTLGRSKEKYSHYHILSTPRGKLNPEKYAVYIIRWTFQQDGNPKINNVSHYNIPMTSSLDGTTSNVRHLHLDDYLLYLRHASQPDGNQTDAFNILIRKVEIFVRRLISSAITRSQVTITNNSIINPTIKYPLATTFFTNDMIDTLHKIIHPTVISRMGYSSRWPIELRYGLHYHCSLKLQHYGLEQLLSKITAIRKVVNQSEFKYLFMNMIDLY